MPVKILLADKSITIQKVVEMLFSGKEYAVTCVSDGEAALNEAARIVPDVVLADGDLPRVDGYSFAARLRQNPSFVQTPIILMQSRDDVFDAARAKQAGILDHIAKPFESQELIGKVKKALTAAPPRLGEPAPAQPKPAAPPKSSGAAATAKTPVPGDIFDIIRDAPSRTQMQPPAPPSGGAEFEVEPVVEIQEPVPAEITPALPVGEKAVEEIRTGLGLTDAADQVPDAFAGFDAISAPETPREFTPPMTPAAPREFIKPEMPFPERAATPYQRPTEPEALQGIAEETIVKIAREVLEKVAWEVIPDLAERLIREEIARLRAET